MPNDPLVKVDRMSMAHGLEVRCPLLDRRVVELAFRIPAAPRNAGRQGKALLRELAKRRLPAALATLPKRGFTAPIGAWIARPARRQVSRTRCWRRRRATSALHRRTTCAAGSTSIARRPRSQLRALGRLGARALAADREHDHGSTPTDVVAMR